MHMIILDRNVKNHLLICFSVLSRDVRLETTPAPVWIHPLMKPSDNPTPVKRWHQLLDFRWCQLCATAKFSI